MRVTIGDKGFEATFNGFTPVVFSRCFTVEKFDSNGKKIGERPKDINEDVGLIIETMRACGMPPMAPLLEILYACVKTANRKLTKPFDKWVAELPAEAFDLQKGDGWAADVMGIVEDNFFPSRPDDVETAPAEAPGTAATEQLS